MTAPVRQPDPPSRAELAGRIVRTLSRGGLGNPDVHLVRHRDGLVVVKDFSARPAWVRATLGRWLTGREVRAYRALAGLPEVPGLVGRIDALAFATEYRPGEPLGRGLAGRLPADFPDRLARAVDAMHARGVVHLDLRHRSNVLADGEGRPVLIDFASALCVKGPPPLRRALVRWLGWFDRRALRKWRARLVPNG